MSLFELPLAFVVYVLVVAFVAGACFASGLMCLAWRITKGESWLHGKSHCDACGHELKWKDLIPIISWVSLKGKCRYCGTKIGKSSVIGEFFLSIVFVLLVIRYGITFELVKALIIVLMLFPAAVCDLYTFEIPDRFTVIGSIAWLVLLPFASDWKHTLIDGLLGGIGVVFIVFAVSVIVGKILHKDAMGGGDFKLFFLAGLYLGFAGNFLNLIISCILGLVLSKLGTTKTVEEDDEIPEGAFPFGPAIALSTLVCLLIGSQLVSWYMSLFL